MEQPPQLPQRKPAPMPGHFRLGRVICRWWWLALLVMVIVTAIGYKTPDWFSMRGPLYQSTALLEVKPIPKFDTAAVTIPTHTPTHGTAGHHPTRFLSTQVEIIQAPATLELAIKQNDLLNRLGGSQTEVLHRMKKSLTVRQKYGTDLLDISYRDEDPTLAQDSLIVILESYAKRRAELAMQIRESEIKSLRAELGKQK